MRRRMTAACLAAGFMGLALGAAGCRPAPELAEVLQGKKANRLPDPGEAFTPPFTFVFYSDVHANRSVHGRLCAAVLEHRPRFVVCGGDCVYHAERDEEWVDFLLSSAKLRAEIPYLAVRGNHDVGSPRFGEIFRLPGGSRWYSLDLGPLHLTVIDTESEMGPESEQGRWLARDLAAAKQRPFTVVCHHRPVYASGKYFKFGDRAVLKHANPLFLEHGVDLSLCGHEHFYERLEADGLNYIVADGAGGSLRERSLEHPASRVLVSRHHYLVLTLHADRIEGVARDLEGEVFDRFTVKPR